MNTTEPSLTTELTRRFSRIAVTTLVAFALVVMGTFALTSEVQLRRSLERAADVVESLIALYADPGDEPTTVAPEMLADMLLDTEQPFLITREAGDEDMRKVYYLSPTMPAQQLESLVPASPDQVRSLLLEEIADRALWRFSVLHRPSGDFDIFVVASRSPMLAGTAVLFIATLIMGPLVLGLARRATDRSVTATLEPIYEVAHVTAGIDPEQLNTRLTVPTGQREATDLAESVNQMLERVDASHRQLKAFTADASHELRTPLTHLKAQVQWALADGRDVSAQREALEEIERELERMGKMIEDLLLIARGENGQLDIESRTFEARALVVDVREVAEAMGKPKQLEVKVSMSDDSEVVGDFDRARHVLLNLLSNAIRYTAQGSVTITTRRTNGRCAIDVTDTGPGIPAEHLEKIFDRFYRVDDSRSRAYGGSGLGLTIARLLARLQGGDITVESSAQGGSTFTLWLPATPA